MGLVGKTDRARRYRRGSMKGATLIGHYPIFGLSITPTKERIKRYFQPSDCGPGRPQNQRSDCEEIGC